MNKNIKIAIAGAVLAALGGGAYLAWQEGMIPANIIRQHPRAPLPENFLTALQNDRGVMESLNKACVRLNLYVQRDVDRMGRAGLLHQRLPGWDVIAIAQVPGDSSQRVGKMTEALSALAQAGIYAMTDTETEDTEGNKLPAKQFSLTLKGWNQLIDDQCIRVGTPRINEITEFSRVMPDKDGKRVYDVKVKYATTDLAAWLNEPALQSMLQQEQLKKLRETASANFRLQRTDEGWEVQKPENDVPELTKEGVSGAVAKWRGGTLPQACIRLPAANSTPGVEVALAPYTLTLFDNDAGGPADARFLAQLAWQSRLSQLVKAGLFSSEEISANPKLNSPAGVRYALDPAYQSWLDMNDARCLRLGDTSMEFISVSVQQQSRQRDGTEQRSASAIAKMIFRLNKDAWINKVNVSLPEVEAIKEAGGVPVIVRLSWSSSDKEKDWRINSLQAPQSDPVSPRVSRAAISAAAASGGPNAATVAAPTPAPGPQQLAGGAAPNGDVVWQSGGERTGNGRVSNQGLTVTYCCAGASSATQASTAVTSGKHYAEFTFSARPRALNGDTWTNIGVMPSIDSRSGDVTRSVRSGQNMAFRRGDEIAHNDVIGIAVDMDAGMVYFSRNGAWLNAQPGAGGGAPLERGKPHSVTAVLSASSSSSGTDSWTANFGKFKFRHALPRGFRSYDGRQR